MAQSQAAPEPVSAPGDAVEHMSALDVAVKSVSALDDAIEPIVRSDPFADLEPFIQHLWITQGEMCREIYPDQFPRGKTGNATKEEEDEFLLRYFSVSPSASDKRRSRSQRTEVVQPGSLLIHPMSLVSFFRVQIRTLG